MQRRSRSGCPSRGEEGSVLVIALFVMIILSLLGTTLLTLSSTEHSIAYNAVWSEGAFVAAESGLQRGISQLSENDEESTAAVPVTQVTAGVFTYSYRSGRLTDPGPTAATFVAERKEPGFSLAEGGGYGCTGFGYRSYRISATGTGPRNAQRQVETLAEYGPICE